MDIINVALSVKSVGVRGGVNMLNSEIVNEYREGIRTLYGVYDACDTDLEFYNFLGGTEGYDEDSIKEAMRDVSGADDAYYNALAQAEALE